MYSPPTISEIKAQIVADIESEIGQATPIFARSFVRVLAKALAGVLAGLYRRILWAYYQIFPQTADEAALAYYENRYGIIPNPATAAILAITITGEDSAVCPAATLWINDASGLVYSQLIVATIVGTTATAQIEALTAGAATTLTAPTSLSLVSPVSGITSAVVASTVYPGQDANTLDERRTAIIARMRRTDEIGTAGYYITQALAVSGIVFARVQRNSSGDVNVYPLSAITGAARIPAAGLLVTVTVYLQDAARRPMGANVYALTSVERTATVTLTGLSPNDAATKAVIEAALADYFYAAYTRQYTDDSDATDVVNLGAFWAIVVSAGATATGVTLAISGIGSGVTSYTLPVGEIIALDSVVYA